jgi:predicted nucleic acid-binding protein
MTGIDTCFLVDLDVQESPRHEGAVSLFENWRRTDRMLAVYSQVFLEYEHIITDFRRFIKPFTMEQAADRVWYWTDQDRIRVIHTTDESFKRAQLWLSQYHLGRNRIADTFMAAAYAEAGITELWTANRRDFEIFNIFDMPEY